MQLTHKPGIGLWALLVTGPVQKAVTESLGMETTTPPPHQAPEITWGPDTRFVPAWKSKLSKACATGRWRTRRCLPRERTQAPLCRVPSFVSSDSASSLCQALSQVPRSARESPGSTGVCLLLATLMGKTCVHSQPPPKHCECHKNQPS